MDENHEGNHRSAVTIVDDGRSTRSIDQIKISTRVKETKWIYAPE